MRKHALAIVKQPSPVPSASALPASSPGRERLREAQRAQRVALGEAERAALAVARAEGLIKQEDDARAEVTRIEAERTAWMRDFLIAGSVAEAAIPAWIEDRLTCARNLLHYAGPVAEATRATIGELRSRRLDAGVASISAQHATAEAAVAILAKIVTDAGASYGALLGAARVLQARARGLTEALREMAQAGSDAAAEAVKSFEAIRWAEIGTTDQDIEAAASRWRSGFAALLDDADAPLAFERKD